jgi:oxepin-CoA hydrolase/3-oxo-5,6-dehydrosuberyl-CoA semialdehyde dehydrogenase
MRYTAASDEERTMIELKSYLRGQFVSGDPAGAATLVDPSTEEPIGTASTRGLDLGAALRHAREVGGPALRALTFAERAAILEAMSKALHQVRDALIEASVRNAGTTRADAKFDIDGATGTLAYYASLGKKLGDVRFLVEGEGEQLGRAPRFYGRHVQTPRRGVAVHVNAFNFPAWGLAEKAAVALLSGVPVVSKPATSTALTAFRMVERLHEARVLPEGALQLVCGGAGDLLDHLESQDVLAFTGGASTGRTMRQLRAAIEKNVRVNIEADSLNAAVLGPDVEPGTDTWQMFVRDVVKEITQKTGQKCTATRRIFVPAARINEVQAAIAERLEEVTVGHPALEQVRMGPLATAQQLRDVRAGVALLVESGARLVFGDPSQVRPVGVPEGKGYFVSPMLLRADRPDEAKAVHTHEVFGPCATLMPYDGVEHAARFVALGEGTLVTSVYSDDRTVQETLVLEIAPYTGRLLLGSAKVADQAIAPGLVLPSCVHGGPGRAGGGEELGGERGLSFYLQRTALQGDRAALDKLAPARMGGPAAG